MVASKSMHIKYTDLCPNCRDNAKLEGRIMVKKLCVKCKRVYFKNADTKKKADMAKRAGNIDLTKNKGNLLGTQMKAVAKTLRKQIKVHKSNIAIEKHEINKLRTQLKQINNFLSITKTTVKEG